jgi:hypothetical protein
MSSQIFLTSTSGGPFTASQYPYLSPNSGATWSMVSSTGLTANKACGNPVNSADGSVLVQCLVEDAICISRDRGNSWTKIVLPNPSLIYDSGITADGNTVVIASNSTTTPYLFLFTYNGVSWNVVNITPNGETNNIVACTISGNGSRIYAITGLNRYISTNNGNSWTTYVNQNYHDFTNMTTNYNGTYVLQ